MRRYLAAVFAASLCAQPALGKGALILHRANFTTQASLSLVKFYIASRMSPTTPLYYCDYTKGALCGIEDWYWRDNAAYTYRNASNQITYAPNNLVLRSADMAADPFTASRVQTFTTDGVSNYILKCGGTGSIAYSGTYSTGSPLDCTAEGEVLMSPTAGSLELTPTGTTTNVRLVKVMGETTFAQRSGVDDHNTGSQPYFGPRLDKNGWLLESDNQNLALYSNDFDNAAYIKTNATLTSAAATSPDGRTNAWLVESTSTAATSIRQSVSAGPSQTDTRMTLSLRVKYNSSRWARLRMSGPGGYNVNAWFDIQNGVLGTTTQQFDVKPRATIEPDPYGNGWYVISLSSAMRSGSGDPDCPSTYCYIPEFSTASADASLNGTAGQSMYVYGFHTRLGGRSSYLPTKGVKAEVWGEVADLSDPRIGLAKALVFETASAPGSLVEPKPWLPYYHTEGDAAILGVNNRGPIGQHAIAFTDDGYLQSKWRVQQYRGEPDATPLITTSKFKIGVNRYGVAYDREHVSISLNGGPVARRTQITPPPSVFTLSSTTIFWNGNTGQIPDYPITRCNCYVKNLTLYQSLTDAQLKEKTKEGAAP